MIFLFSAVAAGACSETPRAENAEYEVWSAPSTSKITRDDVDYKKKGKAEIAIQMAKNEYESAQLVITTRSGSGSYTLSCEGLVSANGDKINAENISFYHEKYVKTTLRSNSTFAPGEYPDALLPLSVARKAGENTLEAGKNQAVWVKVRTYKDTPAGTYTGSLKLEIGGEIQAIPVSVKVWNFAISDESHARTAFNIYYEDLSVGEGDSSDEMIEKYYEFFLDYRVNLMKLPCKGNDFKTFTALVKKYQNDARVNTWCLPGLYHQPSGAPEGQTEEQGVVRSYERISELVSGLIYESVKDGVNYLEKAAFYDIRTDEYSQRSSDSQVKCGEYFDRFRSYMRETADRFDLAYGEEYIDSVAGLRDDILYLPMISVSDYVEGITEKANVWCNALHYYGANKDSQDRKFAELSTPNKELWWYTCVGPVYPYPSYHVDDVLYSSRLMSWMQYDYGIEGNLFWDVTSNYRSESGVDAEAANPYDSANRFGTNNGDGFLVYPGTYYGVDGPVGSLRLESIRDGMEEYEYLYLLDEAYKKSGEYYGVTNLSCKTACRELFDSLYRNGATYRNFDEAKIEEAREKVAVMIENLTSEERFLIEKNEVSGNTQMVSVLLAGGAEVTGKNLVKTETAGNGKRYIFSFDVTGTAAVYLDFEYTVNGVKKAYKQLLQPEKTLLYAMKGEDALNLVSLSEGSEKFAGEDGKISVKLKPDDEIFGFKPYFGISTTNFKNAATTMLGISLTVNKPAEAELIYRTATKESTPVKLYLSQGVNHLKIDLNNYPLDKLTRLVFRFPNDDGEFEITLGEIYYYA